MVLSGVLHWLVSQSIFLVAIDVYDSDGTNEYYDSVKTCGYSPIAIISVLVLGIFMVLAGLAFGFVPFKSGMNLAGSCSAAISAACHNGELDGIDGHCAAREEVKWGVVGRSLDGVGHCAFSDRDVEFPRKGEMYAGVKSRAR